MASGRSDVGGKIIVPPTDVATKSRSRRDPEKMLKRAQRREKVVSLKSAGLTWGAIAKKLGIARSTAWQDYMHVIKNVEMDTVRKAARYARHQMSNTLIADWMAEFKSAKSLEAKALAHDKIISAAQFQARLLGLDIKGSGPNVRQNVSVTVALDKPLQSLDEEERDKLMGELKDLDPEKEIPNS